MLNKTSVAVNGVPSEKLTPSRSFTVHVRPSGEDVHSRASRGSSAPVTRLTRTRVAFVRRETASSAALGDTNLLKDVGSVRKVETRVPPAVPSSSFDPAD